MIRVVFHTGGRAISHVGVYLLNNKFVHASTSQGRTDQRSYRATGAVSIGDQEECQESSTLSNFTPKHSKAAQEQYY
jgi:hypothetical protein